MPKDKGKDDLTREGEPKQETEQGLEIPVPKRKDFFGLLDKVARKSRRGDSRSRKEDEEPRDPA